MSEELLREAVEASGYPLQLRVAEMLGIEWLIQEEWAFVDRTSGQVRAIDLLARHHARHDHEHNRLNPQVVLIMECKSSRKPFVFFQSKESGLHELPFVAGLRWPAMAAQLESDPDDFRVIPLLQVFGLSDHPFRKIVQTCSVFAQFEHVKNGKSGRLTGGAMFNDIVLPLISATTHFRLQVKPQTQDATNSLFLVVPVAVLDAPMVIVDSNRRFSLEPWVRLRRHDVSNELPQMANSPSRGTVFAIDLVHVDFLTTYINNHLIPFAGEFFDLALGHETELISGRGVIDRIDFDALMHGVEDQLRPVGD